MLRILLSLLGFCLGERSGETLMVRAFLVVINIIYLVQVMLTNLPLVLLNIMVTFIICNLSPRFTFFIVVSLITLYFYALGITEPTFMLCHLKVSNSVGFLMMSLLGWANIFWYYMRNFIRKWLIFFTLRLFDKFITLSIP